MDEIVSGSENKLTVDSLLLLARLPESVKFIPNGRIAETDKIVDRDDNFHQSPALWKDITIVGSFGNAGKLLSQLALAVIVKSINYNVINGIVGKAHRGIVGKDALLPTLPAMALPTIPEHPSLPCPTIHRRVFNNSEAGLFNNGTFGRVAKTTELRHHVAAKLPWESTLHTLSHLAEYVICIPRHVCQGMYFYTTLSFGRGVKVGVNLAISLPQLLSTAQTWNVYKIRNTLAMVVSRIFGKREAGPTDNCCALHEWTGNNNSVLGNNSTREVGKNCEALHDWLPHNSSLLLHNSKARVLHNSCQLSCQHDRQMSYGVPLGNNYGNKVTRNCNHKCVESTEFIRGLR